MSSGKIFARLDQTSFRSFLQASMHRESSPIFDLCKCNFSDMSKMERHECSEWYIFHTFGQCCSIKWMITAAIRWNIWPDSMAAMYQHYLSLWFKWGLYVSCKMKFCLLFTCTINTIFSICMNVFALQCIGSHAMLQFSVFLQSIFYVRSSNFCRPCTRASIFLAAWTRGGVIRCESRWQFYLEHGHNSGNSHIFALLFFSTWPTGILTTLLADN